MEIDRIKLKDAIVSTIRKEDLELYQLHNKGIFFLPELAITYLVGKSIMVNSKKIFGYKVIDWVPETRVEKGLGRSDLILELENGLKLIFEFKVRCDTKKYIADINKLLNVKSAKYLKFFCALMDCYAGEELINNKTVNIIEKEFDGRISRVVEENKYFDYFTTKDHAIQYSKKQMSCVIGLWEIN